MPVPAPLPPPTHRPAFGTQDGHVGPDGRSHRRQPHTPAPRLIFHLCHDDSSTREIHGHAPALPCRAEMGEGRQCLTGALVPTGDTLLLCLPQGGGGPTQGPHQPRLGRSDSLVDVIAVEAEPGLQAQAVPGCQPCQPHVRDAQELLGQLHRPRRRHRDLGGDTGRVSGARPSPASAPQWGCWSGSLGTSTPSSPV